MGLGSRFRDFRISSLIILPSSSLQLRAFSLLLLRRLSLKSPPNTAVHSSDPLFLPASSLINTLSNDTLAFIRSHLLGALPTEPDATVRTRLADCVSGLAQAALDDKHLWTELLGTLIQLTGHPEPMVRESVFKIYEECPGLVEEEDPNAVKSE